MSTTVHVGAAHTRCLSASPASVGLARDKVTTVLLDWGLSGLADDAALIMSELATNGVRASRPGDVIKVHLSLRAGQVVIAVWDGSADLPEEPRTEQSPAAVDLCGEVGGRDGGWGLSIVSVLASRWWVDGRCTSGKWVCAVLPVAADGELGVLR